MIGIMTEPMAEVSATAEPERLPKNMQATELTMESPPGSRPTKTLAKSTIRLASPPAPSNCPVMMKKGIARREKALMPWSVCCATTTIGMSRYQSVAMEESDQNQGNGEPQDEEEPMKLTQRIQMAVVLLRHRV